RAPPPTTAVLRSSAHSSPRRARARRPAATSPQPELRLAHRPTRRPPDSVQAPPAGYRDRSPVDWPRLSLRCPPDAPRPFPPAREPSFGGAAESSPPLRTLGVAPRRIAAASPTGDSGLHHRDPARGPLPPVPPPATCRPIGPIEQPRLPRRLRGRRWF